MKKSLKTSAGITAFALLSTFSLQASAATEPKQLAINDLGPSTNILDSKLEKSKEQNAIFTKKQLDTFDKRLSTNIKGKLKELVSTNRLLQTQADEYYLSNYMKLDSTIEKQLVSTIEDARKTAIVRLGQKSVIPRYLSAQLLRYYSQSDALLTKNQVLSLNDEQNAALQIEIDRALQTAIKQLVNKGTITHEQGDKFVKDQKVFQVLNIPYVTNVTKNAPIEALSELLSTNTITQDEALILSKWGDISILTAEKQVAYEAATSIKYLTEIKRLKTAGKITQEQANLLIELENSKLKHNQLSAIETMTKNAKYEVLESLVSEDVITREQANAYIKLEKLEMNAPGGGQETVSGETDDKLKKNPAPVKQYLNGPVSLGR